MAAAALVQSPAAWAELTSALNKKATFEHTVAVASRELSSPAGAAAVADPAARTLLARCRTLLRTRYSSRAFWVLGRQLFTAAATAADAAGDAELKVGGLTRAVAPATPAWLPRLQPPAASPCPAPLDTS